MQMLMQPDLERLWGYFLLCLWHELMNYEPLFGLGCSCDGAAPDAIGMISINEKFCLMSCGATTGALNGLHP